MRTHDNQAPSFQPQPGATTSHAATPHRPEGTFPSQAIAASPTNPFPRRPHEVWMEEPVASRKPVAQAETRTAPESRTTHTEWLQFRLTAPGQPEPDLPPWHSGLTMRAPQRSPSALDLPWREMQSSSAIGQPQDRSEQETDPVATPITTLSESAQPLQRQEEAGEAEDVGEEEKELQPKRLGEFSQPLVQRRVDVEAATFGKGEDAGGGDRTQKQFNLYAPGQAPLDLPQRHGIQSRWALQRSPIAAEPYWYRGKPLQAKLTVGQPNDVYEQEADRVAEQVMSMALPATPNVQRQMEEEDTEAMQMKPLADTITSLVQRQEMLEEKEPLQANCEDCEQEKSIQRSADGMPQIQPDLESRLNASQGEGSALPDEVRSFMEPRFGADFSQVRVHTGSDAVQMNQELNAQAFAHKQDIYFGAGKAPANNALTAHELTHVVQQMSYESQPVGSYEKGTLRSPLNAIHRQDIPPSAEATSQPKPSFNPKLSFEKEFKGQSKDFRYFKISPSFKIKGSLEIMENDTKGSGVPAPITGGPSGTPDGKGVKAELAFFEKKFYLALLGWQFDEKAKLKFSYELTREKLDVSTGLEARINWRDFPWLQGAVDAKFSFASVKWADVQKDPNNVKVFAPELGGGLNGEGFFGVPDSARVVKASVAGFLTANAAPNWANIGVEVAKTAAEQGAKTAGTTGAVATAGGTAATSAEALLAVDTAAVASSAAVIALPLAAAALIAAGVMRADKNVRAAQAGTDMGLKMRNEGKAYVKAYVSTLTGGSASGQGALEANAKVLEYMSVTGKNRVDACADFAQKNGGHEKMYGDTLAKFRQQAFDKGVVEFERKFSDQFGILEGLGESWGMRGVFRQHLKIILYSDD